MMYTHRRIQSEQELKRSYSSSCISFSMSYPIASDRHRESSRHSKVRGQTESVNQIKLQSNFLVLKLYFFQF